MNLYQQDNIEDEILENYVALWRHITKDKRLYVVNKRTRRGRKAFVPRLKKCLLCGKDFLVETTSQDSLKRFCGNGDTRQGCAWIRRQEGYKKSALKRWGRTT